MEHEQSVDNCRGRRTGGKSDNTLLWNFRFFHWVISLFRNILLLQFFVTICVASKIVVESGNKKKIEAENE